ncbi:Z1 domain-containing protein [Bacillus sp. NEB1478]|uniref:Z1 domain-containing protein n=1 Tax=Bacillus sp. NEB1478 TaxID=3073816 RepID=UPI002873252C|nr:Z1 domain-containing protein [Bacillus sp. NEB1478]WNB90926.1 Z1 domain-containing protein [Bacillus sp. NEB1478]
MEKQLIAEEWALISAEMYLNGVTKLSVEEIRELIDKVVHEISNHPTLKDTDLNNDGIRTVLQNFLKHYREYGDEETVILTNDEDGVNWLEVYQGENRWERWRRFRNYLTSQKKRSAFQVNQLNKLTRTVLSNIGNPDLESFDKRGLVVGYVQSGKTENYIALANKAIDAGYKIVIILSGIHNDLRTQTQKRVDEEVIGLDTEDLTTIIGVGAIKKLEIHPVTRRIREGDISSFTARTTIHQVINNEIPTIIVTKKVATVLESLREILSRVDKDLPILIIDDEADQASIDVKNSPLDRSDRIYSPSTINGWIREIFMLFNKRSYVGYTATPFANVLIDHRIDHPIYGPDLFPKDFIIDLPKQEEYLGPEELFGFKDGEGLPLIRSIIDPDKSEEQIYETTEVPGDLSKAIKSFIMSGAVRHLRGQVNEHNSMLIHINRSVNSHDKIAEVVREEFNSIKTKLDQDEEEIINEFQDLWKDDYIPTSLQMQIFNEIEPWDEVISEIKQVVSLIKIMVINGESDDSLDYQKYVEEGLYVIAIGGDKLSRGLTLEGLTVSYYLRSSNTYDTLMQMGRWFGYKKDFEDLCRIYISPDLVRDFRAIAVANFEFRELLQSMQKEKKKPIEFGLRIRSHSVMEVTSLLKLRSATTSVEMKSYAGRKPQTIFFYSDNEIIDKNYLSTVEFLESLPKTDLNLGSNGMVRQWNRVSAEEVINYLEKVEMPEDVTFGSPEKWLKYIKHEVTKENFGTFRVFLMSNQLQGNAATVSGYVCNRPGRRIYPTGMDDRLSIGILRSGNDLSDISSYLEEDLESIQEPILLLYPIIITEGKLPIENINQKIIGLSIVFPDSNTRDLEYTVNTVEVENN